MAGETILVLTILSFIRDTGKLLWNMIKGDCGYVAEYKENVKGLQIDAESLKSKAMDIEVLIEDAEMKGEIIKNEVQIWQKRVGEITVEMQKLEEELKQDKKWSCCCCCTCPDLNSRHSLSKQTTKLKKDFEKVLQQGQTNFSDNVSLSIQGPPPRFTPPPDFHIFESTKEAMQAVVMALQNDQVDVVGVYGMGGVGKTYLVKQVGAQIQATGLFDQVVLATVSQTQSVRKIQGEIADKLGLKLEEESESGRADKLRQRISRCTKILVILDDIWSHLDLSEVGIPKVDKKCKILLTTRREHVCSVMGSKEKISLNILSPDDSWMLFLSASGAAQVLDGNADFSALAREVARECGGLPIALVAVGRALREKSMKVWKIAHKRLEKSEDAGEDGDNERVFKCIKLSYDFLSKDKGKPFFLICCLFPEDHNIDREELARYGMGLGLFPRALTMEEAREETYVMIDHLKDSCLLLNGDNEKSLKMHDVIRDITIRIAFRDHAFMVQAGLGLKECPREHLFDQRCMGISLMSNEIEVLPNRLVCPLLQILLLQANRNVVEISNAFFGSMKALKVLDLNHVNIRSLPTSLKLSPNLRTLCLDGCNATDISILGEIKLLEVLSLKKCKANELSVNIGQFAFLRLLDLTLSTHINVPPQALSRLSRLEELYMQGSFSQWSHGDEGITAEETKASFDELLGLTRLKILKVDVQDVICMPRNVNATPNWEYFNICISSSQFMRSMNTQLSKNETSDSRSLVLSSHIGSLPDWFNDVVSGKAESLIYSECDVSLNIIEEYHKGKLTDLKSLFIDLSNESYLMKVLDGMPNEPVFGSLEELYVDQMLNMKDLCSGELPHGSLEKLNFLEVKQCYEMEAILLPSYLLRRLVNLERLHVSGNSVEAVFGSFEGLSQDREVQRLREMRIENLPKLTSIWKEPHQIPSYNNLKVLVVIQCEKLRSIFPARTCKSLVQLEELWVEDCMQLEEIIHRDELENTLRPGGEIVEENHENQALEKLLFPQLRTLSLRSLSNLTSFYSGSASLECPALEQCLIDDCPKLRPSHSDFHSKKKLRLIDKVQLVPPVQGKYLGLD